MYSSSGASLCMAYAVCPRPTEHVMPEPDLEIKRESKKERFLVFFLTLSQGCLLSKVLSCEMPSCLRDFFAPRDINRWKKAASSSDDHSYADFLRNQPITIPPISSPIETAHAIFKENWITEVHICLKDSISMNPFGEYELIKAKSDPRAEVRLRWVKVVGATYNGGPDLPSTSVVALRNRIRPHPQRQHKD